MTYTYKQHISRCRNLKEPLFKVYPFSYESDIMFQKFKVGLSPSKKISVICFIESPSKMMKNAFYFNLKALCSRDI